MKKILALLILTTAISFSLQAQKRYNHWFFGTNCGLDFSAGAPVFQAGGQISTDEGCSAISDFNGDLLFYTDGISVWNKNHTIMPNGFGLQGNSSSTQAALIVPAPGSSTLYYIFTTGSDANYSVVDITLNGGLGDVTTKNVLLFSNSTERVCAVKHANGTDYWLVFHENLSAVYKAFLLTPAGMNMTPVNTTIGSVHSGGGDQIGYLKPNYQGTKLCIGVRYQDLFDLLDFDNSTGVLSNLITLSPYPYAYGVDFSLDGNILYLSMGLATGSIHQFDLTSGTQAGILASDYLVATINSSTNGALQMGPDFKIYQTAWGNNTLGCINNPEVLGVGCNFVGNQITMPTSGRGGLPNCVHDQFNTVAVTNLCFGDTTFFTFSDTGNILVAAWNFGDPGSSNNTSNDINTNHVFSAPGFYSVQLITVTQSLATDTDYIDVTIVAPPVINLGNDTTLCNGQSLSLNAGPGASYTWQNGSTLSTYTATATGTYFVNVTNTEGCIGSDSVDVTFITCAGPVAALSSSDTLWCDKTCIDFYDLSQNNPTQWTWYFQGASPSTSTDQNPVGICYNNYGSFDVTLVACNALSCDSLFLNDFVTEFQLPAAPVISFFNDTLFSSPAYAYQWFNTNNVNLVLGTNNFYVPVVDGNYFVLISDSNGCQTPSNVIGFYTSLPYYSATTPAISLTELSTNIFEVVFPFSVDEQTNIKIMDITGKVVYNSRPGKTVHHSKVILDLNTLSKGIYMFSISSDKINEALKFIIK